MTTTQQALATLRQAVRGIRFATPSDEAAWIALVLTVVARELRLFAGPAPLFLISGDTGVGKTALATITGLVTSGNEPRLFFAQRAEAEDKKLITFAASSDLPLVCIAGVGARWGSALMCLALTSDDWRDRLLGGTREVIWPLRTTWIATATAESVAHLAVDMRRRVAHIRLVPGGGEVDILRYAREAGHAAREAAIALLDARSAAARAAIAPWGSYDRWSDVVRRALLAAQLPDVLTPRAAAKLPTAPLEGIDEGGLGKASLRHGQRRSHGAAPLTIPDDVERWVTERATDMCVRRESVLRALVSMAEGADAALVEGVERAEADIEVALARERVVIARTRVRVAKAEAVAWARWFAESPCDDDRKDPS